MVHNSFICGTKLSYNSLSGFLCVDFLSYISRSSKYIFLRAPVLPVEAPVMNGFRQMMGAYFFFPFQVGNGPRDF